MLTASNPAVAATGRSGSRPPPTSCGPSSSAPADSPLPRTPRIAVCFASLPAVPRCTSHQAARARTRRRSSCRVDNASAAGNEREGELNLGPVCCCVVCVDDADDACLAAGKVRVILQAAGWVAGRQRWDVLVSVSGKTKLSSRKLRESCPAGPQRMGERRQRTGRKARQVPANLGVDGERKGVPSLSPRRRFPWHPSDDAAAASGGGPEDDGGRRHTGFPLLCAEPMSPRVWSGDNGAESHVRGGRGERRGS
ncbi:hypothetical protein THAOC_09190 [Thalassiosira oceanica]|uniref:Uncharacterized protein n=1 Tax=Thalassiosira oceanica TaxID=159749 RepID=K0ST33_THAOC|nr:hypothetical protein THAOC_09190 [Thalassiosira oceanica]|eukprot:EJK69543.1 hypothetical protein THAOC_09190 [Thalassiosira oceanica]